MAKQIKIRGKPTQRVRITGPKSPRTDPGELAAVLGAERVEGVEVKHQSPPSLFALRQELMRRLTSSGGRPGLKGAVRRQKIPLDNRDWSRLMQIASELRDDDVRPTAGQVASALLHSALERIDNSDAVAQFRAAMQKQGTGGGEVEEASGR